jgi:hypothetical protein
MTSIARSRPASGAGESIVAASPPWSEPSKTAASPRIIWRRPRVLTKGNVSITGRTPDIVEKRSVSSLSTEVPDAWPTLLALWPTVTKLGFRLVQGADNNQLAAHAQAANQWRDSLSTRHRGENRPGATECLQGGDRSSAPVSM